VGWVVLVGLTLALYLSAIPIGYQAMQQLGPDAASALQTLGLSPTAFAAYNLILEVLLAMEFVAAGVVLIWPNSRNWIMLLVGLALALLGMTLFPMLSMLGPQWAPIATFLRGLTVITLLAVFYVFPDGRFVPPWGRYALAVWVALIILYWLSPVSTVDVRAWPAFMRVLLELFAPDSPQLFERGAQMARDLGLVLIVLGWLASGLLAQYYRYKKVATPVERQQTKWVVFGLTVALVGAFIYYLLPMALRAFAGPGFGRVWLDLFGKGGFILSLYLVPFGIGFSMMHYRLWDIDVLIHRALIYGTLTVGVVGFYGLLVGSASTLLQTQNQWAISLFAVILTLGVALPLYRRWNTALTHLWAMPRRPVAPVVRSGALYMALALTLALVLVLARVLLQVVSQALAGPQANLVIVAVTLGLAAIFNPLREQLQRLIDRQFYREKVDFRRAFTEFSREVRTLIDLPELLQTLVTRTTDLFHSTHGAVYLRDEDDATALFSKAEARDLPLEQPTLTLPDDVLVRLRAGQPIPQRDKVFPLLIPLIAPLRQKAEGGRQKAEGGRVAPAPTSNRQSPASNKLVGFLALGPRRSEQPYSREDQALLTGLADQAGTAIYVAQLIREQQTETEKREEAERQLETHRHSPMGRAETFVIDLLTRPECAFGELHALTQKAGQNAEVASMLGHVGMVLTSRNAPRLAGLAEGFNYLYTGQLEPEVAPVGLRTLIAGLTMAEGEAPAQSGFDSAEMRRATLDRYTLCYQAIEASTVSQIGELLPSLRRHSGKTLAPNEAPLPPAFLSLSFSVDLTRALAMLHAVTEALHAYERVDTAQDKLAYLASALERLNHVERFARADLASADRAIAQRITDNWLAVVTGAMSELQTRAQIVCRLLTRHTWQGEVIALALQLTNTGRGAAVNVRVSLAPSADYTALEAAPVIARLAPGEETQIELRARFNASATSRPSFRARFVIFYTDPRGAEQVENFADVVQLLEAAGEFQFIPNPYVVGTPLKTNSPLFFGRGDVVAFIQENLAAAHRNNLVLIGQRRTGKTSLLKQLPARLGEAYVPVYLDGQALGLDPGLPAFFANFATEITFALEDRGFAIPPPDPAQFETNPATTFEHQFLAHVWQAIGERHLLILLDEFEELESAVRRGHLDASIFGFLRHLIQHTENLSVIFCGTHRLEELAADYWNVLFNISLYRHVSLLERAEAERLAQDPVAGYGMRYDDLALDKMWQVTAGHPYFLQLLCHSLVNRHNKTQRNYLTVADVNDALSEILASGEAHFVYLWTESTPDEQLALTALSRMIPLSGQATPVQIVDFLAERGVNVDRRAMAEALHHLSLRDLLRRQTDHGDALAEHYRWKLGLLGLWVEKYRSLSRVVDERKE
jgi:hypothetical protein